MKLVDANVLLYPVNGASAHPSVFARPLTTETATGLVQDWLDQPAARVVAPTARHATLLADLLRDVGVGGNLVNDAHLAALAALAIEHRAQIVTYDADSARFSAVRWSRPD